MFVKLAVAAVVAFSVLVLALLSMSEPSPIQSRAFYNLKGDPKYVTPEVTLKGWNKLSRADQLEGDAQVTSEYVAYAINYLSKEVNAKIRVLTHSQWGINMQCALTFFPSTRAHVQSFVAQPQTARVALRAPSLMLLKGVLEGGTRPSVIRRSTGSNCLKTLAAHGGQSTTWVPTTNIYTYTDEVVEPELIPSIATSYLPGAVNIPVQSIGPIRVDDHSLVVTDVISQYLALEAFSSSNGLAPSKLSTPISSSLCLNVLPTFEGGGGAIEYALSDLVTAIDVAVVVGADKTTVGSQNCSIIRNAECMD